jgi:hypothetical protein
MPDNPHSRFISPGMTRDCLDPWIYVEFRTDGGIAPCCVRRSVGNLADQSLAHILNGTRMRDLRRALLSGEPDETCQGCGLRGGISPAALQTKIAMILASIKIPGHFNAERYLDANSDVKESGGDPARHFLDWGRLEGRPLAANTRIGQGRPSAGSDEPTVTNPAPTGAEDHGEAQAEFSHSVETNSDRHPFTPGLAAE